MAGDGVVAQGGFHGGDVGKLAVLAVHLVKLAAHEPHLVEVALLQALHHRHVLLVAALAQLAHVAQDRHLGRHLHEREVVERRRHRGGVGVVGVHHKVVAAGVGELRTVVGGHIVLNGVVNLLGVNAIV